MLLPVIFLCQGCLIFPYPIPELKGTVIDAETRNPISDARVELHHHKYSFCKTAPDGSFDLPGSTIWLPCPGMPGDIFFFSGTYDFMAPGYETVSHEYMCSPRTNLCIQLKKPIELRKLSSP